MSERETDWYGIIGSILGGIAGLITFIGVMIAACKEAGWVIGIALGWIPAGLAAAIVFGLLRFLWIVGVIGIVLLYNYDQKQQRRAERAEQAEFEQRLRDERWEEQSRRVQEAAAKKIQRDQLAKQVDEFAKDPRHSHYERLRLKMADYMENKSAKTLEEAYAMACAADTQCSDELKAK